MLRVLPTKARQLSPGANCAAGLLELLADAVLNHL